ncbi:MAG: hypothetical protein JKY65_00250 [Planctomycetes bacterium]|nr:hypothetical protein [Planctomycetota bacterium]
MGEGQTAKPSELQRLVRRFTAAFLELGQQATSEQFERWSILVHECMSGRGRQFHNVEHVFDISSGAPPIETLAICFHDAVYCQVDGGLPHPVEEVLTDAVELNEGQYILRPIQEDDRLMAMVTTIFGFEAGQVLSPYAGLNEFLSALLAARSLEPALPWSILAEIVTCIEATIPFRGKGEVDPTYALADRLSAANERFELNLSDEQQLEALHRAVRVSNRDVGNFASEDARWFLDNTWKLLPETNDSLRGQRLYTIGEYRLAMAKMEGFLSFLDSDVVFRAYLNQPTDEEYAVMRTRAEANIALGCRYLRAKLLAASLLEALAMQTGGDAPISLFMGDLPVDVPTIRLESYLPPRPGTEATDMDADVLDLLEKGRANDSGFDMKRSPLAAHLHRRLGQVESDRLANVAKESLGDKENPGRAFLDALPDPTVRMVAEACAHLATTRSEALRAIAAQGVAAALG